MLFNSIEFLIFLPLTFLLYWFVFQKNTRVQNIFILSVSYFFYGYWDWRFLSLIFFSSLVDFIVGQKLNTSQNKKTRKLFLLISILVNLGFLGFFKYYNFFVSSFVDTFTLFGQKLEVSTLNIILPVGISFYTFQTLSYTIDIYKRKLEPTKDIISFFAFVSFFPQLVAGPIERARNLLPQFFVKRTFDYNNAVLGLKLILWGLFMKVVVADRLAIYVNAVYNNPEQHNGTSLAVATILFAFQIYGDFAGYSNIAIGSAHLFGFKLMTNFRRPYFSSSIGEFWKRWHISLSSWFRDYVYIPLGGSKVSTPKHYFNLFVTFLISGLWHGANWTFVFWGGLNGIYLIIETIFSTRNIVRSKLIHNKFIKIFITFTLTCFAWIFFRANNISDAFLIVEKIFLNQGHLYIGVLSNFVYSIAALSILLLFEFYTESTQKDLLNFPRKLIRYGLYIGIAISILVVGVFDGGQFIYFQF